MKINRSEVFAVEVFFFCFHSCYVAIPTKPDIEILYPAVIRKKIAGAGRTINGITNIVVLFYTKHSFGFFQLFKRSDFTKGIIKIKVLNAGPFPKGKKVDTHTFCSSYHRQLIVTTAFIKIIFLLHRSGHHPVIRKYFL